MPTGLGLTLRAHQKQLIEAFLASLEWPGRTLDYGCDIAPYRSIVGEGWHGYNRVSFPSGHKREDVGPDNPLDESWDTILCTQVLQYVPNPAGLLKQFRACSKRMVLTVATNWPEVEQEDWFRYTAQGIEALALATGWRIEWIERLGEVVFEGSETMALGYGAVAT